jgi:hypothetical protein
MLATPVLYLVKRWENPNIEARNTKQILIFKILNSKLLKA